MHRNPELLVRTFFRVVCLFRNQNRAVSDYSVASINYGYSSRILLAPPQRGLFLGSQPVHTGLAFKLGAHDAPIGDRALTIIAEDRKRPVSQGNAAA
jgi:hypothetical protein